MIKKLPGDTPLNTNLVKKKKKTDDRWKVGSLLHKLKNEKNYGERLVKIKLAIILTNIIREGLVENSNFQSRTLSIYNAVANFISN